MLAGLRRFTRSPTLLLQHGSAHPRAALRMDLKTYKPIAKAGKKQTKPDAAAAVAAEDDAPPAKKPKKSASEAAGAGKSKSPKAKKPKLEIVTEQDPVARAPSPAGASFTVRALAGPSCFSCDTRCASPTRSPSLCDGLPQAISWNVDGLRAPGRKEVLAKLVRSPRGLALLMERRSV